MTTTDTMLRGTAPRAPLRADLARRTITGLVTPWEQYATLSTGQRVAFARGSLLMGDRVKLVLDHDATKPIGVIAATEVDDAGQWATFRIPEGSAGDTALLEASEGLRDGLSIGADVDSATDTDDGLYVTSARARHVALVSEPAYDDARVSAVAAAAPTGAPAMPDTNGSTATAPPPATASSPPSSTPTPPLEPASSTPEPEPILTAAGMVPATMGGAVVVRSEPYPYAQPHHLGGPSFVLDAAAAFGIPTGGDPARWHRAEAMAADPRYIAAGMVGLAAPAGLMAAPDTTVTEPALVPARPLPDRYVPLMAPKAPLWTALAKYGTPDFNTLLVPRTATETGLSGKPADEITPIAPGNIGTATDTITIEEVEGAYEFSRKLLMGSNPQIDRIALAAMDRAWLADVNARASAFFTLAANSTAFGATYAGGAAYSRSLRSVFAHMAADTTFGPTVAIPASAEYVVAAEADDTTERPLFPAGPQVNAPGSASDGYRSIQIQGVPLMPGPGMPADKTLVLDQSVDAAVAWVTPVMNFRLEWTGDGNVKVLKLVKYSGVGFWAQYVGGIVLVTNSTPLPLVAGMEAPPAEPAERAAKAAK